MTASPAKYTFSNPHLLVAAAWGVAALILFFQLGSYPLTDWDEGAFSEATREMMARGDWLSPWLLDEPRFDKPALTHWAQSVGIYWAGLNAWGVRLPSALAGLIWIGAIGGWAYIAARHDHGPGRESVVAYGFGVLMAATTLGVPLIARAATADALLNAFLAVSLLLCWLALQADEGRWSPRMYGRAAALVMGLGFLTKGPIALLIPGVATVLASITTLRVRRLWSLATDPVAWALLIAVAAPWYLLQIQAQGMPFIEGFFGKHNVGRAMETMHGFGGNPFYTLLALMVAILPWLPAAITACLRPDRSLRPSLHLPLASSLFVLVLFALVATKLPHYSFYAIAGVVVVMATGMARSLASAPTRSTQTSYSAWGTAVWQGLLLLVLGLLPFWFSLVPLPENDPRMAAALTALGSYLKGLSLPMLGLAALGVATVLFARRHLLPLLVVAPAALVFTLFGVIGPEAVRIERAPIVSLAEAIRSGQVSVGGGVDGRADGGALVSHRLQSPSLSFELRRVVRQALPEVGDWVVAFEHRLPDLEAHAASRQARLEQVYSHLGLGVWRMVALPQSPAPAPGLAPAPAPAEPKL